MAHSVRTVGIQKESHLFSLNLRWTSSSAVRPFIESHVQAGWNF